MQTYDRPDPVFRYDLDARFWSAVRREMASVENLDDAGAGVLAVDTVAAVIDRPPPTPEQIDLIASALHARSIVVVRNAACALWVVAGLYPSSASAMLDLWPRLGSLGRWGLIWAMKVYTPELEPVAVAIVERALHDPSRHNRDWGVARARSRRFRQFIPRVQELVAKESNPARRRTLAIELSVMERGYAFDEEPGSSNTTLWFIDREGELSAFSPASPIFDRVTRDEAGCAAVEAAADPDPARLRELLDGW